MGDAPQKRINPAVLKEAKQNEKKTITSDMAENV